METQSETDEPVQSDTVESEIIESDDIDLDIEELDIIHNTLLKDDNDDYCDDFISENDNWNILFEFSRSI